MTATGTDARHLIPVATAPELRRCRNCGDLIDLSDDVPTSAAEPQPTAL